MATRKGGFSCVVRGCRSRSGEEISLFSIPRDRSRAELWLKAANREDLLSKHADEWHRNYKICEQHFQPHYISKGNQRKTLFMEAHPTIFSHSQHLQSTDEPLRKVIRLEDNPDVKLDTQDEACSTDNNIECETENITIDIISSSEYKKTCRICMKKVTEAKNIFKDHLYEEVPIYLCIGVCISPIQISIEDPLTKYACIECLDKLASFIEFRNFVMRNDKIQRQRIRKRNPLRNEITGSLKRVIDADNEFHLKKKKMKTSEPISESIASSPIQQEGTILVENADKQTKERTNILIVEEEDEHINTNLDSKLQVVNSSLNTDGNVSFCMVSGYLMEHKFSKQNMRYLKCALSKCPAMGKQEILVSGSFKNIVIPIKFHNHKKPTDIEIKKQKVISVVRKKLQVAKGSTVKSVYDEVSKLDPTVAELLPLKVLMAELCNL